VIHNECQPVVLELSLLFVAGGDTDRSLSFRFRVGGLAVLVAYCLTEEP